MEALGPLLTEDDLDWLCDWVIRQPLSEAANRLVIDLGRRLYFPYSEEKDTSPPPLPWTVHPFLSPPAPLLATGAASGCSLTKPRCGTHNPSYISN